MTEKVKQFSGFERPRQNWFKMPYSWVNITAEIKSLAEVKVMQYILRHTWGYKEYGIKKKISVDEFMHGRKRVGGERIDKGTGLSKQGVLDGIGKAIKDGFVVENVDDSDKGRIKKYYMLKMAEGQDDEETEDLREETMQGQEATQIADAGVKTLDPHVKELDRKGQNFRPRTEIDTLERLNNVNVGVSLKKENMGKGSALMLGGSAQPAQKEPSKIKLLPNLEQDKEKTKYVVDFIVDRLGDRRSTRFYYLVAAKIPEHTIRQILSEIKTYGADNPAKMFTFRANLFAQEHFEKQEAGTDSRNLVSEMQDFRQHFRAKKPFLA